jgi:hypothetical protein
MRYVVGLASHSGQLNEPSTPRFLPATEQEAVGVDSAIPGD